MAERESTAGPSGRRYPRGQGWLAGSPKRWPTFWVMFDDIGCSPAALAEHLGCDRTTVYTWLNGAPITRRAYALAMFYETQWGRSYVDAKSSADAQLYGGMVLFQQRQIEELQARLRALGAIADFGSANDPSEYLRARPLNDLELRQVASELAREFKRRKAA